MLEHTFIHIPGISPQREVALWKSGLLSHEAVLSAEALPFGTTLSETVRTWSQQSHDAWTTRNTRFFWEHLPSAESWRLFGSLHENVAYLDIETTGLGSNAEVTTVCVFNGKQAKAYINGENLHEFARDIEAFDLLVTFNGKTFDLPVLRNFFGIPLDHAHIDLRYPLKQLGYKGGLKSIERQLGVQRGDALEEVDGYTAVLLWQKYKRTQDPKILDTLLAYNMADVLNLETLMIEVWNRKVQTLPISAPFPAPADFPNPYIADAKVLRKLRYWR